ncbi:MAG: SDR family NAD(P)-dependent oxidoreductase [Candidatus Aenigmarchaeota archaeon]|nr:SDR family NAD(P)-dependent oxidoreductase [Candidatus Aenigmarchaeota archaeon]
MKALVTGGAGFIGSHLADKLVEMGYEVTILDNLSVTGQNLPDLKKKGIKAIIADITDTDRMMAEVKGFDVVFHLAAMNRAIKSIKDPLRANAVNINGTLNILEACRKNGVGKVVFSSSSSVHGLSTAFPRVEDDRPIPSHPYGVGKIAAEYYTNVYHSLFGMDNVVLRYFSVYGPRQLGTIDYAAVIPKFIHKISRGEEIEVYGDGEQTRSFTYVGDVVEGTIKAAGTKEAYGETINICASKEISVNGLIGNLEKLIGKKAIVKHTPEIKGEIRANLASVSKAKKILSFEASTSMEEGLKETVQWHREMHGY